MNQTNPLFDIDLLARSAEAVATSFGEATPGMAVMLGTGFKEAVDEFEVLAEVPFNELPVFKNLKGISGHNNSLLLARNTESKEVLIWEGRVHEYQLTVADRTLLLAIPFISKAVGCRSLVVCSGVGGLTSPPGSIVLIEDHISPPNYNLFPGPQLEIWKDEFARLNSVYDAEFRGLLKEVVLKHTDEVSEGVLYFWPAKQFQTPAEIRMIKGLGSDIVGKSMVPDAVYGSQLGLTVAGLCLVTNWAEGLHPAEGPDHETHVNFGKRMGGALKAIIRDLSFVS